MNRAWRDSSQTGASRFGSTAKSDEHPPPSRRAGNEEQSSIRRCNPNRGTEQLRWDATSGRLVVEEEPRDLTQVSETTVSRQVSDKPVVTDMASAGFF